MTAVDTDGGSGVTEVSGGGYCRVQVAGALTIGAAFASGVGSITLSAAAPSWLTSLGTNGSGVSVYDLTNGQFIGVVASISGTTVNISGNTQHASQGASDTLLFSAFSQPTGSAPSTVTNGAAISFPQATASWGTVVGFELRDAATGGNLLAWDYLGNFPWLPATISAASPGVITSHNHGYSNGDTVTWSNEYGGVAPTVTSGSLSALNTVANVASDTFTFGVNTSTTGSGMVRKVLQQPIAINVTASFAAGSLNIAAA